MVNVAINGFGRIGRAFFRIGYKKLNIVAINDPSDAKTIAHLLKYDSVYGKFSENIKCSKNALYVGKKKINLYFEKDPEKLPWEKHKIDVVVECSGRFTDKKSANKHIKAGAKKVIISAPAKDVDLTVINGINDNKIQKNHQIISNGSCTTNCLAPIAKIINDKLGLRKGFMVTVHSYTSSQNIVDAVHPKDIRRGRAAAENIIPTTSGASVAVGQALPELKDKIHSSAMRVPILNGSVIYLTCQVKKRKSVKEINELFKKAAMKKFKNIIEYSEEPLVSTDIIKNQHSAIFDSSLTEVDKDLVKIIAWYDNEYGYSCRLVDMLRYLK